MLCIKSIYKLFYTTILAVRGIALPYNKPINATSGLSHCLEKNKPEKPTRALSPSRWLAGSSATTSVQNDSFPGDRPQDLQVEKTGSRLPGSAF